MILYASELLFQLQLWLLILIGNPFVGSTLVVMMEKKQIDPNAEYTSSVVQQWIPGY